MQCNFLNNFMKKKLFLFRLAAPSPSSSRSTSTPRRSRPSPSPTRRRPAPPPSSTSGSGSGHTSVKMSTKRKSPGRQIPAINRSISADPRSKSAFNRSMSHEPDMSKLDLNDPDIKAKIGNRATKTIEKSVGKSFTILISDVFGHPDFGKYIFFWTFIVE